MNQNAGYQVSHSLNLGKQSVFTNNTGFNPNGILNTDGNKSHAGMSQSDIMSHQGKDEILEQ